MKFLKHGLARSRLLQLCKWRRRMPQETCSRLEGSVAGFARTENIKPCRLSAGRKNKDAGRRIRGNAYDATLCFGLEPVPKSISHLLTVAPMTSALSSCK